MIALLVGAVIVVWVVQASWFTDLIAGSALVCAPIAVLSGRIDVAATAMVLFVVACWRMGHDAPLR